MIQRMDLPAQAPFATHVGGEDAYVTKLQPKAGQSAQQLVAFSCADVISVVTMNYHPDHQVYSLARLARLWLQDHQAREKQPGHATTVRSVRCSNVGPKLRAAKRSDKEVRRSARLANK